MVVEVIHLGLDLIHDLVHRLRQVVFLPAQRRPLPGGEHLEPLVQIRRGLDAMAAQQVAAQVVPGGHGVQQRAVHIKNRALQSHGNIPRFVTKKKIQCLYG